MQDVITTVDDLIGVLGGNRQAAEILLAPEAMIATWKYRGKLPASRYPEQSGILTARGIRFSHALWWPDAAEVRGAA